MTNLENIKFDDSLETGLKVIPVKSEKLKTREGRIKAQEEIGRILNQLIPRDIYSNVVYDKEKSGFMQGSMNIEIVTDKGYSYDLSKIYQKLTSAGYILGVK